MSEAIVFLKNVRLSFPHLIDPKVEKNAVSNEERKVYCCDVVIPKGDERYVKFIDQCQRLAVEKWNDKAAIYMKVIMNDPKLRAFGDGDNKLSQKTGVPYDGYEGQMYVSARQLKTPQFITKAGGIAQPEHQQAVARDLYGGCYVNIAVKPWIQDNSHGKAIRCELVAIQFSSDGQPFGESAPDASQMFSANSEDEAMFDGLPSFMKA